MAFINQQGTIAVRCHNGLAPTILSKAVVTAFDFTLATGSNGEDIIADFQLIEADSRLDFVQGVYIDNSVSGQAFSLTAQISGQKLLIASGKQAYLPIIAPPGATFLGEVAAATEKVIPVFFLNFPVPAFVW